MAAVLEVIVWGAVYLFAGIALARLLVAVAPKDWGPVGVGDRFAVGTLALLWPAAVILLAAAGLVVLLYLLAGLIGRAVSR